MAQHIDGPQLVNLYTQRVKLGEYYTPRLDNPRDIVHYFMYGGIQLAKEFEKQEKKTAIIIRYANHFNYDIRDVKEIIRKHQQCFRSTLSRIKNDYKSEGKQMREFKAIAKGASQLEADGKKLNVIVYTWEMQVNNELNNTLGMMADVLTL